LNFKVLQPLQVIKKIVIVSAVIIIGTLAWQGATLYRYAYHPAGTVDAQDLIPVIAGETFTSLASKLEQRGIITDTRSFKLLALIRGDDKKLKAGEYALSPSMTPIQVLDTFVGGQSYLHRLTIPEGYTLKQIAEKVHRNEYGQRDEFITLANDPTFVSRFGIEVQSLEGYLFPDTYYFPKGASIEMIIKKMVERFKEQFPPQWKDRAKDLDRSIHEIVTLASIIEKETGDPSERPVIASVFHNRLKKKMRLESDPTVIYGIPNFDGNIKRKHLTALTPYNTYKIKGLPPGPIANPGRAAIEAALYPAQTDYLFFVSKKDTTHHFSRTIQEHQKAVRKYQLRSRKKSRP
jgi:UPF0755 protein